MISFFHRKPLRERHQSLFENIAAISADFHTDARYHDFYRIMGHKLNGFPGIYDLVIDMAETLTAFEKKHGGITCYENTGHDWIEIVEAFVAAILEHGIRYGDLPDLADTLSRITAKTPERE